MSVYVCVQLGGRLMSQQYGSNTAPTSVITAINTLHDIFGFVYEIGANVYNILLAFGFCCFGFFFFFLRKL